MDIIVVDRLFTLFFYKDNFIEHSASNVDNETSLSCVLEDVLEHRHRLSNFRFRGHVHQPATNKSGQQNIHMHHRHVALIVFKLLSFDKIENTEKQNALKHINHDYIDHVDNFLVNRDLIL